MSTEPMRSISRPAIDAASAYSTISTARKDETVRKRLLDASELIVGAYDTYDGSGDDVTSLAPVCTAPARADDLRSNYTSKSGAMSAVKSAILDANVGGGCPLCGQGRAATLDHYLPRTTFPEFSILPLNLVPACWRCNHTKGATFAESGRALYLHAYLDDLGTQERFLFADVEVRGNDILATFRVDPPASLPPLMRRRIASHFERLKLADYYLEEGAEEISLRRGSVEDEFRSGGRDAVRDYLDQEAGSIRRVKGVNHWRYAVLAGMFRCDAVCEGAFLMAPSSMANSLPAR